LIELTRIASGLGFPEGPVSLRDGSILLVELERGTVSRVDPTDGSYEVVAKCGGAPNGAALGPDGALYVANNGGFIWETVNGIRVGHGIPGDYIGGRIQRVDLDTGRVDDVLVEVDGRLLRGPNDLVFDHSGGFYFTDHGKMDGLQMDVGFVYYVEPGATSARVVARNMMHPNGIGLAPGDRRLYVAESHTGRLWFWDLADPGVLTDGATQFGSGGGNLLRGFEGFRLLDSMAIESNGNICQATVIESGIVIVDPEGELLEIIPNREDPLTTNICFGGSDLCTAFITSAGKGLLFEAKWPRPGLAPHFSQTATLPARSDNG
jgi:gluconolactonase